MTKVNTSYMGGECILCFLFKLEGEDVLAYRQELKKMEKSPDTITGICDEHLQMVEDQERKYPQLYEWIENER